MNTEANKSGRILVTVGDVTQPRVEAMYFGLKSVNPGRRCRRTDEIRLDQEVFIPRMFAGLRLRALAGGITAAFCR